MRKAMKFADDAAPVSGCAHGPGKAAARIMASKGAASARAIPPSPPHAIGQLPLARAAGVAIVFMPLSLPIAMPGPEFSPAGFAMPLLLLPLLIGFMLNSSRGPRSGNVPAFRQKRTNKALMQAGGLDGRPRPKDGGRHD
jgi:hypothetical protein